MMHYFVLDWSKIHIFKQLKCMFRYCKFSHRHKWLITLMTSLLFPFWSLCCCIFHLKTFYTHHMHCFQKKACCLIPLSLHGYSYILLYTTCLRKLPSGRTDKTLFRMKCICGAEVTEVKEIRWEMLPVMTWGIRRIQILAFTSWCVCMSKRIKSKH